MWRLAAALVCSPSKTGWCRSRQISFVSRLLGSSQPTDPGARHEHVQLGEQQLVDPYSWLSDYQKAQQFIRKEQACFETAAQRLAPLRKQLLNELRQHVRAYQQIADPPEADGPYLYSTQFTPHGTQTISRVSIHGQQQQQQQEEVVSDTLTQRDLLELRHFTGLQLQGDYGQLTAVKLSRDHQLLAYGVAGEAPEQQCCIARDLRTGRVLPQLFVPSVTSFEWSADSSCLYYTTPDETGRPSQVYRRDVSGQAPAQDTLLFREPDPKHFVTLTRTKDWAYVLINSTSKLSTEVHLLDARDAAAKPMCVLPRQPGLEYFVEHTAGHLLILTNLSTQQHLQQQPSQQEFAQPSQAATDYSLYTVPVASVLAAGSGGCLQDWRPLLLEAPGTAVTDMNAFDGVVVLHTLHHSRPQLMLLHVGTGQQQERTLEVSLQQEVQLPEWALWLRPGNNSDYNSRTFRLYASSPAHPEVPLQVDFCTGVLGPLAPLQANSGDTGSRHHQQQHDTQPPDSAPPGSVCRPAQATSQQPQQQQQHKTGGQQRQSQNAAHQPPEDCGLVSERLWATAPDGTAVPLTLLRRRRQGQGQGSAGSRPQPLLVEVYGAYGHVLECEFKPHRLTLLQRGWSVALAHVRGGGELGRRWHASGRQLLKPHSVTDLLACLQHLIDLGVTRPGLIAGHAASAGALTLAAAINARPDCFSAAVLEAPYVDWVAGTGAVGAVSGQPLVGNHLLTEHETDEWGDPWSDPAVAMMIASLCPYSNLPRPAGDDDASAVRYPALMLTAGLEDSRVPWWMPVKFVARLRSISHNVRDSGSGTGGGCVADGRGEVLLQFDEGGSHFSMGLSGGNLQDAALQQAFLCTHTPN